MFSHLKLIASIIQDLVGLQAEYTDGRTEAAHSLSCLPMQNVTAIGNGVVTVMRHSLDLHCYSYEAQLGLTLLQS